MTQQGRTTFNEVAELYDRVRPRYPDQLFKELCHFQKLSSSAGQK
jgi:hypothetical protein